MVAQRAIRRQQQRLQAQTGKANMQTALNNFLWKVVMNNGGVVNMPVLELKQVPLNAAIRAKFDSISNSLIIYATLNKDKPNIITPNDGLIL